jgi:sodium/bile acid cotransporter 7
MVLELGAFALLPTLAGQVVRQFRAPGMFADRHKLAIGVLAQLLILLMILRAACNAGAQIEKFGTALSGSAILMVWGTCVALHLFGLGISLIGARKFGMSPADQAAVAFAGSQKTLPIGILLATNPKMFGDPDLLGPGLGIPFAVFPMLMYHASQLFIDTLVADHLATHVGNEPVAAADDVTGDG